MIDILIQCLIEQKRRDITSLREDEEIDRLFNQLEIADKRERSSFYPLRRAHYFSALKNHKEALDLVNRAITLNSVQAYATRAEIRLAMVVQDPQQLNAAEFDIKELERLTGGKSGARRNVALIAKLRIRFYLAKQNHKAAVQHFEKVSFHLGKLREKLAQDVDNKILQDRPSDSDLVGWANRTLSGVIS